MEDDPTTQNSNLSGHDKVVLTKNTETINAFSSHVMTTKANTAHTGKRIDVMTQALHVMDGSLLGPDGTEY